MAYTSANYPEYAGSAAIAGKKFLLYIAAKLDGESAIKWNLCGGLRDTGLEISADAIDASDKSNDGWGESIPGLRSWSSSPSMVVKTGNETLKLIENWVFDDAIQNARPALHVAFVNSQTKEFYDSWCTVASYSIDAAMDDVMQVSCELNGVAPLIKKENFDPATI